MKLLFWKKENDKELIDRWINNRDEEAYNEIYKRYGKKILNFAFNRTKNKSISEETVQHALMMLVKYPKSFKEKNNTLSYLFTIANRYISKEYNTTLNETSIEEEEEENFELGNINILEKVDIDRRIEIIRAIMDELPSEHKQCYYLRRFEEKTPKEIAKIMGKTPVEVQNIIYFTEAKIKKRFLEKYGKLYEK